jgi:hypothetical protein
MEPDGRSRAVSGPRMSRKRAGHALVAMSSSLLIGRTSRGGEKAPIRPKPSQNELAEKLKPYKIDRIKYPLIVADIRGYYRDSAGSKRSRDLRGRDLY